MLLLDFKKPPYQILESVISYTGKYRGFLGTHYHSGVSCWVVGAINKTDGEITAAHYNEKQTGAINATHAKAEAQKRWANFSAVLLAKPQTDEADKALEHWYDQFQQRMREGELRLIRKRSDA